MAASTGLREVFSTYTYSFIISGGLIIFGFQMLAFALLTLQSKFYFEELFKLGGISRSLPLRRDCRKD
jgi:hypothetical protein